MAIIHHTTLTPSKVELLAGWLPAQPWYRGESAPQLAKAGGFRLDDPDGAVGIEFMVATEAVDDQVVAYLVPLSYRGTPLPDGEDALIGTMEHGVLGTRWAYDGVHDPVLVSGLVALLNGDVQAQAQSTNDTPDPTVSARVAGLGLGDMRKLVSVQDGSEGTDITVLTSLDVSVIVRVNRVLRAGDDGAGLGEVTANWKLPDGTAQRGRFFEVTRVG
jgi:hypothetical protein